MGEEQHLSSREMDKGLADYSDEMRLESLNKSESTGNEIEVMGRYWAANERRRYSKR